jgi:hypothetical protein
MHIKYDFLREVLTKANERYTGTTTSASFFINNFPESQHKEVETCLNFLITTHVLEGKSGKPPSVKQVSPRGYDFLQTIAKDEIWQLIKETLDPIDECPFELVVRVSYDIFAKQRLNLE